MNHTSVKAQKLVQCALRGKGVAQHVPITTSIMNVVRGANAKYLQELEEEKKKKRKAQEEAEAAAEAKKKKDKIDLAKKTWGEKKR